MSSNRCLGCDTPILYGSSNCPMCGAKVPPITGPILPVQVEKTPIVQTVTEVHHHHHVNQDQPLLIEATGKKWKKLYLWAWLFLFFGMTSCMTGVTSNSPDSSIMQLTVVFWAISLGMYIRARFGSWWHHG